ncbi:hypothetical protein ES703_102675 [subsurface metagenome]
MEVQHLAGRVDHRRLRDNNIPCEVVTDYCKHTPEDVAGAPRHVEDVVLGVPGAAVDHIIDYLDVAISGHAYALVTAGDQAHGEDLNILPGIGPEALLGVYLYDSINTGKLTEAGVVKISINEGSTSLLRQPLRQVQGDQGLPHPALHGTYTDCLLQRTHLSTRSRM